MSFDTAYEVSHMGSFSDAHLTIRIFAEDGPVPYFHFVNKEAVIHGCIRLDRAEYFVHNRYMSTLSDNQKKALVEFLLAPVDDENFPGSNWSALLYAWNTNNPQYKVSIKQMPDYLELP